MLTERQRRFAIEYSVSRNAKAAAEVAGYTHPRAQGARILKHPEVRRMVDAELVRLRESALITAEDVRREAWYLARTAQSEGARVAALTLLARHLGMLVDRTELSGPGGGPIVVYRDTPPLDRAIEVESSPVTPRLLEAP